MLSSTPSAAVLNRALRIFFSEFVRVSLRNPGQAGFYARTVLWQRRAARRRARHAREGLHVPPIAVLSVTHRCNLRCTGCYAHELRGGAADQITPRKLRSIVEEADELGISFIPVVGGEPLLRPEIVDIARDHPRVIFLLVTNGMLLDEGLIAKLKTQRNTVPVLSIEGTRAETDARRGRGVHERLREKMTALRRAGIFFSLSFTVTRQNFDVVTHSEFLSSAVKEGCRLFFFVEYTPVKPGTDDWVLTDAQRRNMKALLESFRAEHPAIFIGLPWDEEEQGGCLAAGRGFIHVSASGDLEPCPFAPFSDTNLLNVSLRDALRSTFLRRMRENHQLFAETEGGCSLWKHREAVEAMLEQRAE